MSLQVIDSVNPLWSHILQKLRHDFYHLPEYVALEAKRNRAIAEAILIVEQEKILFVPYLVRHCSDIFNKELLTQKIFDVVSPYGYPGILLSEAATTPEFIKWAMNELVNVLHNRQICSAFLRLHPILNYSFSTHDFYRYQVNGETVSVNLNLSEAEIWHDTRPEHRNKINKCKKAGFSTRMVLVEEYLPEFIVIYEETMNRVGASKFYYFDDEYFLHLAKALGERLHLCVVELEGQIACAGLFTECCAIVQYHLGGTKTEFLKQAPSKLMFDYVRSWAKERGNEVFHLGGGVGGSKDSLFHFKAGFSKQRHNFLTIRLVTDEEKYRYLVELRAKFLNTQLEQLLKTDFFPAYRSPG